MESLKKNSDNQMIERLSNWKEYFQSDMERIPEYMLYDIEHYVDAVRNDLLDSDCYYLELRADINMLEACGVISDDLIKRLRDYFL